MILTVTLNSALDKVIFIKEWLSGRPMRTEKIVTCVGGKGLDSSVVLRCLGVETVGLALLAGESGEALRRVSEAYGMLVEPIWVEGETRLAHVIVETKYARHSHVIAGRLRVLPQHLEACLAAFRKWCPQCEYVICAGSVAPDLPAGLYGQLVAEARRWNVPVLIDSSGPPIRAAIPAKPAVLKMNWDEFEATFEQKAATLAELVRAGQEVYQAQALNALVLTCAAEGLLAFTPQGYYHTLAPAQRAVNAAGAGDAVSSALAWRFTQGDSWKEALRWAGAVSAAVVLTEATAECRLDDIQRIYPQVRVVEGIDNI